MSKGSRVLHAAVDTIASFVDGFEAGRYTPEDATTLVAEFTRAERLCAAGKAVAAARVAESNKPALDGQRTPAEWLANLTGESVGEAASTLKLGEALDDHAGLDAACRQGKLSRSRATLLAGALSVNPQSESDLLKGAERDTFRQLKDRCLRAKAEGRSSQDAARAYEAIRKARYCRTWTDAEGAFRLDASLTPDAGANLLASLRTQSDRLFRDARASGQHEPPDAYAADALVALVTGSGTSSSSRSCSDTGSEAGSKTATDSRKASGVPGRSRIHLRVDLDALRRGSIDPGEMCEIPGVGPVPVARARELMGEGLTDLVITNGVDVTTICRLGRAIPGPLKTALLERDQTCVVPDCDTALGLEFDHWAVSFANHGTVSLENIARLCAHHHYLRTHKDFELHGGPGTWRWEKPKRRRRTGDGEIPLFTDLE